MKVMSAAAVAGLLMLSSTVVRADKPATVGETKPIQLALVAPDLQMVPEDNNISGLRLEVYGRNANVNGVDLGFIHAATGDFNGVAIGLVDLVGGHMHGVQWSWFYNQVKGDAIGWPNAIVNYVAGNVKGLETGLVNLTDGDGCGVQIAIYNRVGQHISGGQLGIVNRAQSVKGLQLGIVNLTTEMDGIQIGIWNQIDSKENWKVIPIVNWKF